MLRFGATNVLVRRRPRRWPVVALAVVLPALAMALQFHGLATVLVLVEAIFVFFLPAMAIDPSAPTGERRVATLHADREGISFGDRLVLRRAKVASMAVEPLADGRCAVQLWGSRARDDLAVTLPDADRAHKMLDALGFRDDRHAERFVVESAPLRTPGRQRLVRTATLAGAGAIFAAVCAAAWEYALVGFMLVPLLFIYFGGLHLLRRRTRILLGSDALVLREPIGLTDIADVKPDAKAGAQVEKKDGKSLLLRFDAKEKRDAFVGRLQKSLARGSEDVTHVVDLVAPAERGVRTWLDGLRALGRDSYRGAAVPTEDLWRVVEHPGADAGARAGAVAALVARLDEPGRMRLGELAEGTAKAELRAALEAAAEEGATDEAVLRAYTEATSP